MAWLCGCSIDYHDAQATIMRWDRCDAHRSSITTPTGRDGNLKPLKRLTSRASVDTSILGELIECRCSHPISAHAGNGCLDAGRVVCPCTLSAHDVLEYALSSVRTEWGQWSEPA
jgi:hypothetical protein